jgi:hypothetical protein
MKSTIRKFVAVVSALIAFNAYAGISFRFDSDAPETQSLSPGQTFTVTLTARIFAQGNVVRLTQLGLNPNAGSQFQIVGGTCNTTTSFNNNDTCTVLIQFVGNQSGNFTANLTGACQSFAAVGGYSIACGSANPGATGTLAAVVGNGIAAVVNAMGREGFTALALALVLLGSWATLRNRSS